MSATPYFPLTGGLDLATPAVALKPGRAIAALNYEPTSSGYQRLRGFERFDGRFAPSAANYILINFTGGRGAINDGDILTDVTGVVPLGEALTTAVVTSGSYGGLNAVGYFVVAPYEAATVWTTSHFVAAVQKTGGGTATVAGTVPGLTAAQMATLTAEAKTVVRARILVPTGSGAIRGVWYRDGKVLAFRDNAGATAGSLFTSSSTGWVAGTLAKKLTFTSGGTYVPVAPGRLYMAGTSGASPYATILSVTLTSGSWAAGDAAGFFMVIQIGALVAGNLDLDTDSNGTTDQLNVCTIAADGVTLNFAAGGRYSFINHNFYGAEYSSRVYGVNGVGSAFSYDGTYFSIIPVPGMTTDKPTRIAEHKQSLFLAFPGGSVQFSTVGEPTSFDAVLGAGEIGIGTNVADFISIPNALGILGETNLNVLYGSDSTDYQLEQLTDEAGALPYTAQRVGDAIYMDNRGIRKLSASQAYGNFSTGALSFLVAKLLEDYRRDGVNPTASVVSRAASQYLVFFDNGTGLVVFLGRKEPEILPFKLGVTINCACAVEDDGVERIFLGGSDGYVYEYGKGTSFDGAVIEHYLRLPFNHFGSPQMMKRIDKVVIDVEASGTTTLSVSFELDHGTIEGIDPVALTITVGGAAIDGLGSNELYYASQIETSAEAYIHAGARNISMKVVGSTSAEEPHTLTGATYFLQPRRQQR